MNRYLELFDDNPPPSAEELQAQETACRVQLDDAEYKLMRAELRLATDRQAFDLTPSIRLEDDRHLARNLTYLAWVDLRYMEPHPGQEDRYHELLGRAARIRGALAA